ncbi:MAG: AI-2E family transporter [Magnetococcales bacterium]|nr:AI-2E family transporter [Magnetococcales bacterium]
MTRPFALVTRRLQDPQVMAMILVLTAVFLGILFFGAALAPYITGVVLAYLLEGMVRPLLRARLPRLPAVLVVFSIFLALLYFLFFGLVPNLVRQLTKLVGELPRITEALKGLLEKLSEMASGVADPEFVQHIVIQLVDGARELLTDSVTYLVHGLPGLLSLAIYLVLVPFLVFFFMKDKEEFLVYLGRFLPQDRELLTRVLRDADAGVGGYVRGKFWELLLLGLSSYVVFVLQGFDYAFLLGVLTGLSVLIPFLGLVVVMVPVAVLGVVQWGVSLEAMHPLLAYGILQAIDGNIVAPIILGETVKVHPTTIILSVLLFGSIWGLVGVFFAVPLVVLTKSVFEALVRLPNTD